MSQKLGKGREKGGGGGGGGGGEGEGKDGRMEERKKGRRKGEEAWREKLRGLGNPLFSTPSSPCCCCRCRCHLLALPSAQAMAIQRKRIRKCPETHPFQSRESWEWRYFSLGLGIDMSPPFGVSLWTITEEEASEKQGRQKGNFPSLSEITSSVSTITVKITAVPSFVSILLVLLVLLVPVLIVLVLVAL